MSMPEHRQPTGRRPDPRLLVVGAFAAGALLGAVVAGGLVAVLDGGDDAGSAGTVRDTAGVGSTTSPGPSRSAASSPGSGPGSGSASGSGRASPTAPSLSQNEQRALMTKPLAQLAAGDRVVYNMVPCRFRHWVGSGTSDALIACRGEPRPFQARTADLVPVEIGGD